MPRSFHMRTNKVQRQCLINQYAGRSWADRQSKVSVAKLVVNDDCHGSSNYDCLVSSRLSACSKL